MTHDKQTPRTLIFAAGTTGGLISAITAEIVLGHFGLDLAAVWREVFASRAAQMHSAVAWWLIAGFSFVGGLLIAAFARYFSANWCRLRLPRWIGGAVVVGALTWVGHLASAPSGLAPGPNVVVGLGVMLASVLLSMLGAFFIVRH